VTLQNTPGLLVSGAALWKIFQNTFLTAFFGVFFDAVQTNLIGLVGVLIKNVPPRRTTFLWTHFKFAFENDFCFAQRDTQTVFRRYSFRDWRMAQLVA
jgi:hypothetical protein